MRWIIILILGMINGAILGVNGIHTNDALFWYITIPACFVISLIADYIERKIDEYDNRYY